MSISKRICNFLYNDDRAIASLFGAPAQETMSSEIGRASKRNVRWGKLGQWILDHIQHDHCEHAIRHADALDKVDDGEEK